MSYLLRRAVCAGVKTWTIWNGFRTKHKLWYYSGSFEKSESKDVSSHLALLLVQEKSLKWIVPNAGLTEYVHAYRKRFSGAKKKNPSLSCI